MTESLDNLSVKRRRVQRRNTVVLTLLTLVVTGTIAVLAVAFQKGQTVEEEKLMQTMPDGSTLVLEKLSYGTQHRLEHGSVRRGVAAIFGGGSSSSIVTNTEEGYVVFLSQRTPSGQAGDFRWWSRSAAIDEHGCEIDDDAAHRLAYSRHGGSSSQAGGRPFRGMNDDSRQWERIYVHSRLRPFRNNANTVKLRVYNLENEVVAEFDAPDPNPKQTPYPVWEPDPLPTTAHDGDLEVTLTRLTAAGYARELTNQIRVHVIPELQVVQAGQPSTMWPRRSYQLYDAIGNSAYDWDCRLCPQEKAWKLAVRLYRSANAQFDPSETWTSDDISVDKASEASPIGSHRFGEVSVRLVAFSPGGPVSYSDLPKTQGGGDIASSGTLPFGAKTDSFQINTNLGRGTASVISELPHVAAVVTGIAEDYVFPDLVVTDDQGRAVPTWHNSSWSDGRPTFWFLNLPSDAKSIKVKFLVQKARKVEFLVKPPRVEPVEVFAKATALARSGNWSEAAEAFARGLEQYDENHWNWYRSICLQAYTNSQQFREQSKRVLELYRDTQDPFTAERTAKMCALLPNPDIDLETMTQLADRALTAQPTNPWFLLARGIVEYRRDRWEPALDWLQKAEQAPGNSLYSTPMILIFKAMSQQKLGQSDAAKTTLKKATEVIEHHPKIESGPLDDSWHDWLMCRIARREAEAIILEDATP